MSGAELRVLGRFELLLADGRAAGPWERPIARRVLQLLAVRDGHRVAREVAQELFFPALTPQRSANALSKALNMARKATAPFELVAGDRQAIWLQPTVSVDVDQVRAGLDAALALPPGRRRDDALVAALQHRATLLEEERYADWAGEARDSLDGLRATARRTLAQDRAAGHGRVDRAAVAAAWSSVLMHEPADEEACLGLLGCEISGGHGGRAVFAFERTVQALSDLGIDPSAEFVAGAERLLGSGAQADRRSAATRPTPEAARAAADGGRRARRQLADRAARALFVEAVTIVEALPAAQRLRMRTLAFDAHLQLGELARDLQEWEHAEQHFRSALPLARGDGELALVWCGLGSVPYRQGDLVTAIERYRTGSDSLSGDDPVARLRVTTELAFSLHRTGHGDDAIAMLEEACADLDEVDDAALVGWALDHLSVALRGAGRLDESLAAIQRAFDVVGVLGDEHQLAPLHIHRASTLSELGRTGEGLADIAAALRIARAREDAYVASVAHWVASELHERSGAVTEALENRDAERTLLLTLDNERNMAGCEAARARLLLQLGRADEARTAAEQAHRAAARCGDGALSAAVEQELLPLFS